jgi:hypothetical protein
MVKNGFKMENLRAIEINPSADSRWDEFIENQPLACVFHHSAWKEVLENSFPQLRPCYLIAENENGEIKGAIPLFLVKSWITGTRLVSLPFSLYCDPLVDSDCVSEILIKWILYKKNEVKASYVEIRTRLIEKLFKESKFKRLCGFKNHTLCLEDDLGILKKNFDRTCVRQRINRAKKSNIIVAEASSEKEIRTFFELHCMTRKKYGIPVQPYDFFKNMWKILYPQKMIGVLIAKLKSQPISAILFLKYKQRVHAEYMGTNDSFLKYSPNILLFWESIKLAKNEGYKFFDFGGSSIKNKNLINFKKRWGTIEEDILHYYYPNISGISTQFENNIKIQKFTKFYGKMPDNIFNILSSYIYRHLGG